MSLEMVAPHKLTSLQRAFAEYVALGVEPDEAIVKAGYSEANPSKDAWRLMQQPQIIAAIQINAARELALSAPAAIKLLRRFVTEDKWDARVRLAAAKTLLDRAGYIPPKAVDASKAGEKPLNDMSTTELRALADKLEGEMAGRAKDVHQVTRAVHNAPGSASAAPVTTQAIEDII